MKESLLKKAFIASIPVLSGYLVLGIGFGMVLKAGGYGPGWAFAMSTFIYAGSMEFVGINLMTGGASLLTTAITTLMVNARHLFYGISMVDRYRDAGKYKPYLIFALTDETYSLVCGENKDPVSAGGDLPASARSSWHRYCFLLSLLNQIYWVTGSVIGSILGDIIPFSTEGIDFALTALFITVFTEQWLSEKKHFPATLGVSASVVCLLIFGPDSFLIPSMAVIASVLLGQNLMKKKGGRTE